MKFLLPLFVLLLCFSGCKKDDGPNQSEIDRDIILQYIEDNNLDATGTASGLYFTVDEQGSGDQPDGGSTVTVAYTGTLTNGEEFDSSSDLTIGLNQVIQGWREGIPKYQVGGSGLLLIPSGLGYGSDQVGSIPANSVLIFEVELKAVF